MIGVTQFAKSGRTNEVRPPPPLRSAPGPPLRQRRAARPTKRSGYCLVGAPAATSRLHLPRPLRPIRPHCRQATGTAAARWRSPTMAWMDEYCRGVGGVGEGWRNKGTTGRKFVLWANWRWIAAIVYYDVAPVTHARLDANAKRKWSADGPWTEAWVEMLYLMLIAPLQPRCIIFTSSAPSSLFHRTHCH